MNAVTLEGREKEETTKRERERASVTGTSVIILSYRTTSALGSVVCKL